MKTLRIICITLVVLSIVSCTTNWPATTEVITLVDVTDRQLVVPTPAEVLSLYPLSGTDKWNGSVFRISKVSDVSLNKTAILQLEQATNWFSNELEREREVKEFQDSLTNLVEATANDSIGKSSSSVYLALA